MLKLVKRMQSKSRKWCDLGMNSRKRKNIFFIRFVDNGKIILYAGISTGIDMSLYVASKLFGKEQALKTAQLLEYKWEYN